MGINISCISCTLNGTLGYHVRVYIGCSVPSNEGGERMGYDDDSASSLDGSTGGTSKKGGIRSENRWVGGSEDPLIKLKYSPTDKPTLSASKPLKLVSLMNTL